jgi:hypothetical protein
MNRPWVFRVLATGAVCAAIYHAMAAMGGSSSDGSSPGRHAVFVAINLGSAWYSLRRPLWGLPLYGALVVQQTQGHGSRAMRLWAEGAVDWISIGVLVALYLGLVMLVLDARDRYPRVRRLLCPLATS